MKGHRPKDGDSPGAMTKEEVIVKWREWKAGSSAALDDIYRYLLAKKVIISKKLRSMYPRHPEMLDCRITTAIDKALYKYNPDDPKYRNMPLDQYFFTVARNAVINMAEKEGARKPGGRIITVIDHFELENLPGTAVEDWTRGERIKWLSKLLERAIAKLNPEDRQLAEVLLIKGETIKELATWNEFGSESTVRRRMKDLKPLIRKHLRVEMGRYRGLLP